MKEDRNVMTVELLQTLAQIGYILSGVFLVTAIVIFFLFKITKVIGDVSGSTAKKAIENIRQQNENSGDKAYKPSPVNVARGKLTDKISPSGKLHLQASGIGVNCGTEKISTQKIDQPLGSANLLIKKPDNKTTILEQPAGITTVLNQSLQNGQTEVLNKIDEFAVEVDMGFTESKEIIE